MERQPFQAAGVLILAESREVAQAVGLAVMHTFKKQKGGNVQFARAGASTIPLEASMSAQAPLWIGLVSVQTKYFTEEVHIFCDTLRLINDEASDAVAANPRDGYEALGPDASASDEEKGEMEVVSEPLPISPSPPTAAVDTPQRPAVILGTIVVTGPSLCTSAHREVSRALHVSGGAAAVALRRSRVLENAQRSMAAVLQGAAVRLQQLQHVAASCCRIPAQYDDGVSQMQAVIVPPSEDTTIAGGGDVAALWDSVVHEWHCAAVDARHELITPEGAEGTIASCFERVVSLLHETPWPIGLRAAAAETPPTAPPVVDEAQAAVSKQPAAPQHTSRETEPSTPAHLFISARVASAANGGATCTEDLLLDIVHHRLGLRVFERLSTNTLRCQRPVTKYDVCGAGEGHVGDFVACYGLDLDLPLLLDAHPDAQALLVDIVPCVEATHSCRIATALAGLLPITPHAALHHVIYIRRLRIAVSSLPAALEDVAVPHWKGADTRRAVEDDYSVIDRRRQQQLRLLSDLYQSRWFNAHGAAMSSDVVVGTVSLHTPGTCEWWVAEDDGCLTTARAACASQALPTDNLIDSMLCDAAEAERWVDEDEGCLGWATVSDAIATEAAAKGPRPLLQPPPALVARCSNRILVVFAGEKATRSVASVFAHGPAEIRSNFSCTALRLSRSGECEVLAEMQGSEPPAAGIALTVPSVCVDVLSQQDATRSLVPSREHSPCGKFAGGYACVIVLADAVSSPATAFWTRECLLPAIAARQIAPADDDEPLDTSILFLSVGDLSTNESVLQLAGDYFLAGRRSFFVAAESVPPQSSNWLALRDDHVRRDVGPIIRTLCGEAIAAASWDLTPTAKTPTTTEKSSVSDPKKDQQDVPPEHQTTTCTCDPPPYLFFDFLKGKTLPIIHRDAEDVLVGAIRGENRRFKGALRQAPASYFTPLNRFLDRAALQELSRRIKDECISGTAFHRRERERQAALIAVALGNAIMDTDTGSEDGDIEDE